MPTLAIVPSPDFAAALISIVSGMLHYNGACGRSKYSCCTTTLGLNSFNQKGYRLSQNGYGTIANVGIKVNGKFKSPVNNQMFDTQEALDLHLKYLHDPKKAKKASNFMVYIVTLSILALAVLVVKITTTEGLAQRAAGTRP
jgi:hypothetical protein